jgi:hypothetical protein
MSTGVSPRPQVTRTEAKPASALGDLLALMNIMTALPLVRQTQRNTSRTTQVTAPVGRDQAYFSKQWTFLQQTVTAVAPAVRETVRRPLASSLSSAHGRTRTRSCPRT